jgi:uncharacterized protein
MTASLVRTLFVLALLLASSSSIAADERRAQALEVGRIQMPRDRYVALMDQIFRAMLIGSGMPQRDQEQMLARANKLAPQVVSYEELMDMLADILAKHFTADELRQLHDWYLSPLGQKQLQLMPTMMGEVGEKLQTTMPARMKKLFDQERAKEAPAKPDAGQ